MAAIAVTGHLDLGRGRRARSAPSYASCCGHTPPRGTWWGCPVSRPGRTPSSPKNCSPPGASWWPCCRPGLARAREAFARLLRAAVEVVEMPFDTPDFEGYAAANEVLLARSDLLVAVWDGAPPQGPGGTGDLVRRARDVGRPVVRVWPQGASRGEPGDP
ncbi:hypothetical protein ACFQZC_34000 [Streptacidiphilus monticola]